MGKISLSNIAEELSAKSGITREAATNFMHSFIEMIEKGLQEDGMVKIKGLGTFKLQEMSDRVSVDVNTGERITIKGYRKVAFTPDSAMKELVNRPFAHFEPTELNEGYPEEEQSVVLDVLTHETDNVEVEELVDAEEQVDEVETVAEEVAQESVPEEELPVEDGSIVELPSNKEDSTVETPAIVEAPTSVEEDSTFVEELVMVEEIEAESIKNEQSEEPLPVEENIESSLAEESEDLESDVVVEQSEPVAEEVSQTPLKQTKRRGWGWLVVLLLLVVVCGAYYWHFADFVGEEKLSDDTEEVYAEMTVNPNLKEELGAEWGDEPEVGTSLSTDEKVVPEESKSDSLVVQSELPAVKLEDPIAPEVTSCAVVLTESLKAKSIKDITPSDTTDYVFDGTLIVHKLQNGETIIQLANKYYSDKRLWPYIVKYNKMKNFNSVAIGQEIRIPILKEK